jgi:hypothetical protein
MFFPRPLLLEHQNEIQKEVFWSTATLLNLTVDLIFFDTTNTYGKIGAMTTAGQSK